MKHVLRPPLGLLLICWGTLALLPALAEASPITLTVTPSSLTTASSSFELDVAVDGVSDLYAFGFDLGFDPTKLSVTSESEGSFLASGGETLFLPGAIDNLGGTIAFTADTLLTAIGGVSGSGNLAVLLFHALGEGTSAINIFNAQLLDSNLNGLPLSITEGEVTVVAQTVPEPGTITLFGLGLTGLVTRHWARRTRGRDGS